MANQEELDDALRSSGTPAPPTAAMALDGKTMRSARRRDDTGTLTPLQVVAAYDHDGLSWGKSRSPARTRTLPCTLLHA